MNTHAHKFKSNIHKYREMHTWKRFTQGRCGWRGENKKCYSHLEYLEIRAGIRPPQLDADPLKGSKINGGPQVLEVYHTLKWGLRLEADLSAAMTRAPPAGPHLCHSSQTRDLAEPQSWAPCLHPTMLRGAGGSRKRCQLSRRAPAQHNVLIVFSGSHFFFLVSRFCFIPFLFLLPECTSRVPCHGNTCRWRQSSSSTSFASAEEVTNHSTSREVLSPRYPWTICKRGCPWSTRFSQVFRLLLRTSVKALFPLFASHHIPCLHYFTQSCKLAA